MGRSVITHPSATAVAYADFEPNEETYREYFEQDVEEGLIEPDADFDTYMYARWNDEAQFEWEYYLEALVDALTEVWPSFEDVSGDHLDVSRWSEQTVLVRNAHSEVSISEYCGSVAISLAPRSDLELYYGDEIRNKNLGDKWRADIAARFEEEFGTMTKLGTFSDGTSVYMKGA